MMQSNHQHGVGELFAVASKGKYKGAVIPIYAGLEQKLVMVVRVDKIYTDYQRKGFFRIGVLPIGVMEGVTFEVRNTESLTNFLVQLRHWFRPQAAGRLEFRQVTLQNTAPDSSRLQAGRMRVLSDGKWELQDDVRLYQGTNQIQANSAILQISGEQTGQIVLATTPPWTNNLFARTLSISLAK